MNVAFVRGAYLNNFEGQSYDMHSNPDVVLTGYASLFPLDLSVSFPVVRLPSIADLQTIPLMRRPIKYVANRTLGDAQILYGLENHIGNADIVHCGDPHYYYTYQAARLKAQGNTKKLISTWWETIPFNNESTRAKKYIKHYSMHYIDGYICHTKRAMACLQAEGIPAEKIYQIPLGVDLTRFSAQAKKGRKIKRILFVGRFVEEKGVMDVYKLFKRLAQKDDSVELELVGQGPLSGQLQKMIANDKLDHVVFVTHASYSDMAKHYHAADIIITPSHSVKTWEEQLGVVLMEAMATGTPIVAYDSGAIAEVVGNAGILVSPGNTEMLFQSVSTLLSRPQVMLKLGTMGVKRAKKLYDAYQTAQNIYAYYRSHLDKK